MIKGCAISKASRGSIGSKNSDKLSWKLSVSRRSVGQVHSSFSLHTRFAKVLAEDRQDAFDPNATAIKVWQQLLLLCILLEAFLLPYGTAFHPEAERAISKFSVPIVVCETVFTLDLYIQACTGYYSDGNLIRDKKRTVQRYVYSWQFVVDLVALLPVRLLGLLFQPIVPWVSLLKLIRWSRLPLLVSNLDELYSQYFVALKFAKVVASTLYLAHVLACVRYRFGEDSNNTDHWLPGGSLDSHSLHRHHYLVSLFWSVGVMTGLFEGKLPHHSAEFLFTIAVALCGFSLFTTLCATIFVISKCESGNSEAMSARINQLMHVLSFHSVPESQKAQAIEYLKRYYTDTDSSDRDTVKLLCPSIANDIKVELLKATIAEVSLFNGCSDDFLIAMTSLLEMIAVPAQTTLFSVGDYGDAMYVVHSGVFATICDSVTVRELRKGSCFGEISVFSSLPRTATIVSTTYAIVYKLSRFHCERVLEGYPECASVISVHVQEIVKRLSISDDLTDRAPGTTPSSLITPLDKPKNVKPRRSSATSSGVPGVGKTRSRGGSSGMSFSQLGISSIKRFSAPLLQDLSQSISYRTPSPVGSEPSFSPLMGKLKRKVGSEHSARTMTQSSDNSFEKPKLPRAYTHRGVWKLFLLRKCIDHQSRARMWWILTLLCNLCYLWVVVPLQVFFPLWQRPSWISQTADTISNSILLFDVWMNLNLSFEADSGRVFDPKLSAKRYLRGGLTFDVLCAVPYEYLHMKWYGIMRLPHLLRVYHLKNYLNGIGGFVTFNNRQQLALLALLCFITFHVVACIYFGISYIEGFDPNEDAAWVLPTSLCLRRLNATHLENCEGTMLDESANSSTLQIIGAMEYSRSLYYAVGVLASPGKSVEPASDVQLVAALTFMLSGFLITGIVVDNVQKRFTASAFEQKQFFETSTRVQLFLRRQKAPLAIHHRTKSFLDYWWASHRGAVIRELLADFPQAMRLDLLRSVCTPVLQTLALLLGVYPVRGKLEEVLVENAEFILFGQGETVYRHGDYVTGLYFLLEGEVCVVKGGGPPSVIPRGGFFGTAVLTQQERGDGYTEHVSAASGCVFLFVSREQISVMESIFPALKRELLELERRLTNNKLLNREMRTNEDTHREIQSRARVLEIFQALLESTVYDPDSMFVMVWETWVFVVMTTESVLVIFQACFPLHSGHANADALTVFLEVSFILDMFIRSRLGFYEYGNKIMDLPRIKHKYQRSWTFVLDIAALLPLYVINWCISARQQWNLVNINKLLRLFKVPRQLHALETRYLKRTTELRLFKLLYYTFVLSHFLGCIWFDFASKEAVPNWINESMPDSKIPTFGQNLWLPSKRLEQGSNLLQYMASLYWSFGLMSASSESQFPTTTAQCLFSVATMISGMFLFAYVIGNFMDVIELTSSESREFKGKMNAVRQMLDNFRMSDTVQERVKAFLFFKRFHTITQESLLAQCLPPSLLTDIRLVYLRPMIEQVDFLAGMDITITRVLVSQFTQVLASRGEFVFRRGDNGSDMYFIFAGVVDVLVPSQEPSHADNFKLASELSLARKRSRHIASTKVGPMQDDIGTSTTQERPKKMNEMSAGSYFGENSLFTNGQRDAHIQAQTSCILYRLSRESLELVFDRYPRWKQKVLRIATIHREQTRLLQISREEQRHRIPTIGKLLSRSDIVNERAEAMKEKRFYAGLHRSNSGQSYQNRKFDVNRRLFKPVVRFLADLVHGIPAQGTFHLCWLRFIVCCTLYISVKIPYQLTIDPMERKTSVATLVNALGLVCKFVFALDVWVSWHVQESTTSMELYDEKLRSVYMKERMHWDIIAAIPLYDMLVVFDCSRWVKLLRCMKMLNIWRYLDELNRNSIASETTRFWHVCVLYLLAMYWAACAYLAVAVYEGFGVEWEAWLPSQELEISDTKNPSSAQLALLFLRGLFFAMTTFVKKSYNPPPETATLYAFHIGISFVGLMVMSFVIGELASLFISYIGLEVEFRKNSIAVNAYLARLRIANQLKVRAGAFMTSLWSSHAGVNYEELLREMPRAIRSACVLEVSRKPVTWFVMKVFTPVCWSGSTAIDAFTLSLTERLQFEIYPRDENVVTEGNVVRAMYFVVKGHLTMQSHSVLDNAVGLRGGSCFGERGLLSYGISRYTVRTMRACDLLSISSEAFAQVLTQHTFSRLALQLCDQAYKDLKQQQLVSCSRAEMEELWGAALLQAAKAIRNTHEATVTSAENTGEPIENVDGDAARKSAITTVCSFQPETTLTSGDNASEGQDPLRQDESDVVPMKGGQSGSAQSSNSRPQLECLSEQDEQMFKALDTTHSCFEAFAPLLHIMLAIDPLEWHSIAKQP